MGLKQIINQHILETGFGTFKANLLALLQKPEEMPTAFTFLFLQATFLKVHLGPHLWP